MTGQRGYAPFTYRGLVEFLTMAEDVLDSLGDDQDAHQEVAHGTSMTCWLNLQSIQTRLIHL